MKKADKFEITIDIHKKIRITKKMVFTVIVTLVLITLVVSKCNPETLADIIRLLISCASGN
ncbi:MAG: hypothetical protein LUH21_04710 [Clostridiales bacterium]|nr:hypothetical protein [Clostridiales bacterium]